VVLAFVHNDVRNNSRELEGDPARPYFDWVDGQLVLDESFRDSESFRARTSPMRDLRRRLGDHSYLLQLLDEMRSVSLRRNVARTTIPIRGGMYGTPADPAWDKAWQTTEALIAALHDEVRADGALFLVVTLSDGPQVHPDPAWRATFAEENGVEDFFYSEKRIVRLARRENIPLLVLAPRLREIAESQSRCLHGFENAEPCQGHWNQLGHAIGGGLMGEALCQLATTRNETALPLPGLPGFEGL
jgi:hypothetical protein